MRTYYAPFKFEDLDLGWIQERHRQAFQLSADEPHIQRQMINKWSVTFRDQMTGQILGCFGVMASTRECWAFLDRRTLAMDCYRPHRVEIVRWTDNILTQRQEETGEPVYARVDGDDPKDEAYISTIGFKKISDEWYQRGDYQTPIQGIRGVQYDLHV